MKQIYALRKQGVRLRFKKLPVMQIVAMTGLIWPGVRAALKRYEAGGMAALKPAIRGKKPGAGRSLSTAQEQAICRVICNKRPEQLKMEFALWRRAAVGQLIEQEYGIKLHVRSLGKYLARWGFTPQKPIKKAYEQRPEAVRQWLDAQYPVIAEKARAEGGEIHRGDVLPWSIPASGGKVMRQQDRRRWPTRRAAQGRSYRCSRR